MLFRSGCTFRAVVASQSAPCSTSPNPVPFEWTTNLEMLDRSGNSVWVSGPQATLTLPANPNCGGVDAPPVDASPPPDLGQPPIDAPLPPDLAQPPVDAPLPPDLAQPPVDAPLPPDLVAPPGA